MANTSKRHRRVVAFAVVGLALVGTGLSFAVLSNPKRFSENVADDRYIQLFAIVGFACTLAGSLLFLFAVRNTTQSMPVKLQRSSNIGMGLGFVLQLAGLFLPEIPQVSFEIGLGLLLAGFLAFLWGGMYYAQGKGYSSSLGWWALLGILGLIVLILLPPRESKLVAQEGT